MQRNNFLISQKLCPIGFVPLLERVQVPGWLGLSDGHKIIPSWQNGASSHSSSGCGVAYLTNNPSWLPFQQERNTINAANAKLCKFLEGSSAQCCPGLLKCRWCKVVLQSAKRRHIHIYTSVNAKFDFFLPPQLLDCALFLRPPRLPSPSSVSWHRFFTHFLGAAVLVGNMED